MSESPFVRLVKAEIAAGALETLHIPLVDGFCPECAHEAHLDVLAAQPVNEAHYGQLADHLYDEHGIKPRPYRRSDPLWNLGMAEAVHRHIHASADPGAEQGQEWSDHDVTDLGGLEYDEEGYRD